MASLKNEGSISLQLMGCLMLSRANITAREIGEIVGCSKEHVTRSLESPSGMDMMTKLRREAQTQIFDPVQQQLDLYSRQAMQELWELKDACEENEKRLKRDILVDVLHMGGYRPHTNTDKQAEQLPTVIMGTMNVQVNNGGNNGDGPQPLVTMPDVRPVLPEELTDGGANGHGADGSSRASNGHESGPDEIGREYTPVEASDDPRFESVSRWTSGEVIDGENGGGSSGPGDTRSEQFEPSFTVE